jgi:hypothetical protein
VHISGRAGSEPVNLLTITAARKTSATGTSLKDADRTHPAGTLRLRGLDQD